MMMKFVRTTLLVTGLIVSFVLGAAATVNAAPPAKAFGELPLAYDADISPDGKHLAVVVNVDGMYYAATRKTENHVGKMDAISLGKELRPRYIKWVNNERFVISVEKSETFRGTPFVTTNLFTKSLGSKKGRFILTPRFFRQFNDRVVDWLEDDPEHILMAYSEEQGEPYPDIFKVNVTTGKDSRVQRRKMGIEYWITDETGKPVIGRGQAENGDQRMKVFDPQTEDWRDHEKYPGLDPDTPIYNIMKNGTEVIIGDYNGRDTLGLYIYDLKKKSITRSLFHSDEYDASGVVVSADGETVIGAKYVADKEETELLGEYGTSVSTLRDKFKGFSVRYVDQTDDGEKTLVRISAPYEPGGLYLYNNGDAMPTQLQNRYSGLRSEEMGDVFPIKYSARDGQKIPAYVTLPPSIKSQADFKNLPFIVLPHGGPYGRDEKRFDYFAQFFATRGYGVMQMNFRGSEGYGKAFKEAGRDNWLVMQEDVEDATRFLLSKGYSDPNRTCIAGWSYGGYAALMGAAKDNDGLYDCVITMAALTDINGAKRDMKEYRGGKYEAKSFFGEAMEESAVRKANSPIHVAGDIKVPVFLAHGDLDVNVQFGQFIKMRKALKKAGVKHTALEFEDEDHFLSRQENREAFFVGVEKFLLEVNGPSEFMAK